MRRWFSPEGRLPGVLAGALLMLATCVPGALAADTREEVAALFAAGRMGDAFDATEGIEDPTLRAEWRFHLLYTAGDFPGALAAARAGLEGAPDHAGLLANATRCGSLLGLGQEALVWAVHLEALPGPEGETQEQARARQEQTGALVDEARRIAELEDAGADGEALALRVALGGLVLALGALLLLARSR